MLLPYIDSSNLFLSGISFIDQKKIQVLQNNALIVCSQVHDPVDVPVKRLHMDANIFPIDLRRKYLQGVLCYRLLNINALNLVDNRRTRAADGPLIKTYISHTERIRKSPPNSASDEWNMIPPSVRLPDTKLSFKTKLRKLVNKCQTG